MPSYQPLVDLIEKYKTELGAKAARQAVALKVIEASNINSDIEGFAYSFSMIACYIRDNNIKEWQVFVEQITKDQIARGVPDAGALAISDFMINSMVELVKREFGSAENKALHDKFQQRIQTMHSLGRVMIIVTQIKERGILPKR